MIKINGATITQIRGDSGSIDVNLRDSSGNAYALQAGDSATFSVKEDYDSEKYVLQKSVQDGKIKLDPADTADLQPGVYVYDIQTVINGAVDTVAVGTYTLQPDVTK